MAELLPLVIVQPMDDGNGRIGRAVGDLALARAEGTTQRHYSRSAQIQRERKDYYAPLERNPKGTLDVTDWIEWFLGCIKQGFNEAIAHPKIQ